MAFGFQANAFAPGFQQAANSNVLPSTTGGAGGGGGGSWTSYGKGQRRGTAKVTPWKPDEDELEYVYRRLHGIAEPTQEVADALAAVEKHAEAEVPDAPAMPRIDWQAVANDIAAVEALLDAYESEMDDEDAILAILMAA